jgi:hypothetical protein
MIQSSTSPCSSRCLDPGNSHNYIGFVMYAIAVHRKGTGIDYIFHTLLVATNKNVAKKNSATTCLLTEMQELFYLHE